MRDQAWRERYPGSDGIRTYYQEFLQACDDLRIDVHEEHVCVDTIVLEVTISGTHTGSWHGLLATGRRFKIPLCGVYTFDDHDRLAGERIYYDRATVFAQLGIFHEPVGLLGKIVLVLNHPLTVGRSLVRAIWK
jgi:predicted ester cyclase